MEIERTLRHLRDMGDWNVAVVDHPDLIFNQEWEVTTNASGEYFLWEKPGSEHMLVWINTYYEGGKVFATCNVPTHVCIDPENQTIEIGVLRPELTSKPDQP